MYTERWCYTKRCTQKDGVTQRDVHREMVLHRCTQRDGVTQRDVQEEVLLHRVNFGKVVYRI